MAAPDTLSEGQFPKPGFRTDLERPADRDHEATMNQLEQAGGYTIVPGGVQTSGGSMLPLMSPSVESIEGTSRIRGSSRFSATVPSEDPDSRSFIHQTIYPRTDPRITTIEHHSYGNSDDPDSRVHLRRETSHTDMDSAVSHLKQSRSDRDTHLEDETRPSFVDDSSFDAHIANQGKWGVQDPNFMGKWEERWTSRGGDAAPTGGPPPVMFSAKDDFDPDVPSNTGYNVDPRSRQRMD